MTSKRDELARAFSEEVSPGYWERSPDDSVWRDSCYARVDWFLDALMEIDDEIFADLRSDALQPIWNNLFAEIVTKYLTHIREGKP